MNDGGFKRKLRRPLGAARGLEEKINDDMGGISGLALETNHQSNQNETIAGTRPFENVGIYGQRRNRSLSAHRMRTFPSSSHSTSRITHATPARSVAQSTYSRFSRFSKAGNAPVEGGGVRNMITASTAAVHIVCAISENLARETCVSSLDAGSPTSMHVSKQGNSQTYAETLAYLEMLQPDEVLLNEGRRNSQMARKVVEFYNADVNHCTDLPIRDSSRRNRSDDRNEADDENQNIPSNENATLVKFISRSSFDQTRGAELLQRIAREDSYDASLLDEYILLASSNALLQFVQQTLGAMFLRNSLFLSINAAGNNRMTIDRSTTLQLELLVNAKTGKVRESLIGSMDCTKTTVGSRLLRANLIAPPSRSDTIHSRLELVDLFLSSQDIFSIVFQQLDKLPDIDRMLSSIALVPRKARIEKVGGMVVNKRTQQRMASKGISALMCIKSTLETLPGFAHTIEELLRTSLNMEIPAYSDDATIATGRASLLVGLGNGSQRDMSSNQHSSHRLIRAILVGLTQPGLATVLEAVTGIFMEAATFSRRPDIMRHNECFAFKCTEGSIMSVLRQRFKANVDEIYKKADEYAEIHGISSVAVRYSASRGYFLAVPISVGAGLPSCFVQPAKSGRFITCTTREVAQLNNRAQDNIHELLTMTHHRIQEVMDVARAHYDDIATLCDSIALLDMCQCFADNVMTSSMTWCRPSFSELLPSAAEDNTASVASHVDATSIVITKGRYPITVSKQEGCFSAEGPSELVPNDTYATEGKHFTVITGINGSGKSTYLKQVAIIVVMAHCGSYVTAENAIIPLRDRVCCRIGNADDQKHNISTFMLEMRETAFICNSATSKSLILIDELGRATSNEDGVAIAWATSEYLMKRRALTFFVTHYPQLTTLANIYPCVQNIHLEAFVSKGSSGDIRYAHKARPGACTISTDYGIEMAVACGWPLETVDKARSVQEEVQALLPDEALCSPDHVSDNRTKAYELLSTIGEELRGLSRDDAVQTHSSVRAKLHDMQERHITSSPNAEIVTAMKQLLLIGSNRRNRANNAIQATMEASDELSANHQDVGLQSNVDKFSCDGTDCWEGNDQDTLDSVAVQPRRVTTSPYKGMDCDTSGHRRNSSGSSSSSGESSESDSTTTSSMGSSSGSEQN